MGSRWAAWFFIIYRFFMTDLLLNIIEGVMIEAYSKVEEERAKLKEEERAAEVVAAYHNAPTSVQSARGTPLASPSFGTAPAPIIFEPALASSQTAGGPLPAVPASARAIAIPRLTIGAPATPPLAPGAIPEDSELMAAILPNSMPSARPKVFSLRYDVGFFDKIASTSHERDVSMVFPAAGGALAPHTSFRMALDSHRNGAAADGEDDNAYSGFEPVGSARPSFAGAPAAAEEEEEDGEPLLLRASASTMQATRQARLSSEELVLLEEAMRSTEAAMEQQVLRRLPSDAHEHDLPALDPEDLAAPAQDSQDDDRLVYEMPKGNGGRGR
jgi:hypothetical protein